MYAPVPPVDCKRGVIPRENQEALPRNLLDPALGQVELVLSRIELK